MLIMVDAYRVFVVLDEDYGERLSDIAPIGPVWSVDTPPNREAAQKLWVVDKSRSHLDGVTTFKAGDCSAENALINNLGTIDLHHGVYSADPPYTVIEVIGTVITERLETETRGFRLQRISVYRRRLSCGASRRPKRGGH